MKGQACIHIRAIGGDFICADCLAKAKGFRDIHHLNKMAELIRVSYECVQVEKQIGEHKATIARLTRERDEMVARHDRERYGDEEREAA